MEEVNRMVEPSDEELVHLAAQGDGKAFAELIRRYEGQIAAIIRRRIADPDHADDVLQETLLDAWTGLARLRDPGKARVWLLQIARNRCRDFHKSAQRRGQPTESEELDLLLSRYGRGVASESDDLYDLADALDSAPPRERDIAKLFYIYGFTVAEIARRHACPEGTIKHHLFDAREHVRRTLGVPEARRKERAMSLHRKGEKKQPLPIRRPDITVTPSSEKPFAVDFREGAWWFGIPEVGQRVVWGIYDPPDWKLTYVYDEQAVQEARVHDLDCVEVNSDEWEVGTGWSPSKWTMYVRLTEEAVEWVAVQGTEKGKHVFRSYLDEGFDADWGPAMPRQLADGGTFVAQTDGTYAMNEHAPGEIGAGMFDVTIGEKTFTCLRVIDTHAQRREDGTLMEAFLTCEGRTVLCRRYNGRRWAVERYKTPWDEKFPDHQRLVIDGVTYVHWYDCLTHLSLGVDLGRR